VGVGSTAIKASVCGACIKEMVEEAFEKFTISQKVGYFYDPIMMNHRELTRPKIPEVPERIERIHNRLVSSGLYQELVQLPIEKATLEDVRLVHTQELVDALKHLSFDLTDPENPKPISGVKYDDIKEVYSNEFTFDSMLVSCGASISAVRQVVSGAVHSAFVNARPPGHHASSNSVAGFCFVNNVAVAAKYAIERLGLRKVLILDWDVHHGNGTQDIFQESRDVMFISLHRYDNSTFYPFMESGSGQFCGVGDGRGFSFNVAWNTGTEGKSKIGDADYKKAFDSVIFPIAKEFGPELIIVSAGFDAMIKDPLGMMSVTQAGYSYILNSLKTLAGGKVVVVLEGGYSLKNLEIASEHVVKTLLEKDIPHIPETAEVTTAGKESIAVTHETAKQFFNLPDLV